MSVVQIPIAGEVLAGEHIAGAGDAFQAQGRLCVVMAAGAGFAHALAAAGLDVLRFDGRGSAPEYQAAVAVARALPDVRRIVLWGVATAGGCVLEVAAQDREIVAVIALTPAVDRLASIRRALRAEGIGALASIRRVRELYCPVLVQVADEDSVVPVDAAMRAAWAARADVRHYPCDHFDVAPGGKWFEQAVEHQLAFLRRRLVVSVDVAA